jgi:tryptophan 2,3-dioxygenase
VSPAPLPITYWDYIRVEQLLALQAAIGARSPSSATTKSCSSPSIRSSSCGSSSCCASCRTARDLFHVERVAEQELSGAVRSLKRACSVLRVANQHWEVMETLTTREFLAFRDKLFPASGFQSAQLRQIEILFGLSMEERIPLGSKAATSRPCARTTAAPRRRSRASSVSSTTSRPCADALEDWLFRTPIDGSDPRAPDDERKVRAFLDPTWRPTRARSTSTAAAHGLHGAHAGGRPAHSRALRGREGLRACLLRASEEDGGFRRARIRAAMLFIETYRELPLLAWPREVLDAVVELEQFFVIFRQRHARMVERVIGRAPARAAARASTTSTRRALKYRIFRDLWAIRTLQVRRAAAPKLAKRRVLRLPQQLADTQALRAAHRRAGRRRSSWGRSASGWRSSRRCSTVRRASPLLLRVPFRQRR